MRNAGCAQSSAPWSRTRWPRTRKTANLSTRARLATTHASDWACGRQGEGHSPEHARMTSDHTRLLPKAEGDTCSLPTYNKKCSHTVRSGSSVNRGPDPLTRLAAVVSVRHSPGDSLFRFAKTNSLQFAHNLSEYSGGEGAATHPSTAHTTVGPGRVGGTRKTANLSTRARLATTHASDWACGRQGEGHSPEHARMTSDHTRLLPKAEGDTCSLPTYNKKCSHTVRSGSSVNRGPDPLTRLAAVVSVRHSPGDSLFRFAKTNSLQFAHNLSEYSGGEGAATHPSTAHTTVGPCGPARRVERVGI